MIYFDNAATTYPKPQIVMRAVREAITDFGGNPGRSGHKMSFRAAEKIYRVRKAYADFFGTQPENIVFSANCTMALNFAIKGVMSAGGHAVTSDMEHNSVVRPLYKMSKRYGVKYDVVKLRDTDDSTVAAFESKIREETKAIIVTYASNVTGRVLPIERLGALCRRRKLTLIVDAAQAAGVVPINMSRLGINILCAAGHKSLYGISGTGIMAFNDPPEMGTLFEGGTGSVSVEPEQPDFLPDRFESGTVNTVGILSLGAGLRFVREEGVDNIYTREQRLCKLFVSGLSETGGVTVYSDPERCMPIVSFNLDGISSTEVVEKLSDMGFALRGGLHCAPSAHKSLGTIKTGTVRFSPGAFSTAAEVKQLIGAIGKISLNKGI